MSASRKKPDNKPRLTPAQQQLVVDNMRLAWHVSLRTWQRHEWVRLRLGNVEDCHTLAMTGLVLAARGYDPSRKVKFSTYASHCIFRYIQRAATDDSFIRAPTKLLNSSKISDSPYLADVERAKHVSSLPKFYDAPVEDPRPPDNEKLYAALKKLSRRDRHILVSRYWGGRTLQHLANEFEISKERVRQLQLRALSKLREMLGGQSAEAAFFDGCTEFPVQVSGPSDRRIHAAKPTERYI